MDLTLHLTEECNLRCAYCFQPRTPARMSAETALAAVSLAAASDGPVHLSFYGGEPMLEQALIRQVVVRCAALRPGRTAPFFFQMTTNGTLLDGDFLRFAKRVRMALAISYDGPTGERARPDGGPADDVVLARLRETLRVLPYTPVMMTVTPSAVGDFSETVRTLVEEIGARYVLATPALGPRVCWSEDALRALSAEYRKVSALYLRWMREGRKFYFGPFESKIMAYLRDEDCSLGRCELGRSHLSVAPDGSLYPCTMFVGNAAYRMGSAQTGIDETARARLAAPQSPQPECGRCALSRRCRHSCGCVNLLSSGDAGQTGGVQCAHEQMLVTYADRLAARLYREKNRQFLRMHYDRGYALLSLAEDALRRTRD